MDRYDAEVAPAPADWLALDEGERVLLVEQYHRDARIPMPKRARHLHATIHTIVENQLALDSEAIVRSTLARLMKDGLTRHDAIHAIGSVLAEYLNDLMHAENAPPDTSHAPYYASLEQLTVEKWRKGEGQ